MQCFCGFATFTYVTAFSLVDVKSFILHNPHMNFLPTNFRYLSDSSHPAQPIRVFDGCTLILIKSDGEASFGRTRAAKDEIIAKFAPEVDLLLLAWTGQYRTDIFHLTAKDLENYYK